jgi:tetratricopeptide (TPR) repeat protein
MPDFENPAAAVIRALDAGHTPHARQLARELVEHCDSATMLQLSQAFAERGLAAPLADLWQLRERKRGLVQAEATHFADALNALAVEHMREARFVQARPLLHLAREAAPENPAVLQNLASAALALGEYQGALDAVGEALTRNAQDPALRELRGRVLYQTGDAELSVEDLAFAFDAGRASAGIWLIKALCLDGRVDEAFEDIEKLLNEHPGRAMAMLELELSEPGSPLHVLDENERVRELFGGGGDGSRK